MNAVLSTAAIILNKVIDGPTGSKLYSFRDDAI
jgi:hypothetical protein